MSYVPLETVDSEGRKSLTDLLVRLGVLPERTCKVVLHCLNGKVSSIELSSVKVG